MVIQTHNQTEIKRQQESFYLLAPPLGSLWKHYKGGIYQILGYVMRDQQRKWKSVIEMLMVVYCING